MKLTRLAVLFVVAFVVSSCSTPQEDAARAEEEKTLRRMELVEQYQACMKKNEGNKEKQEVCDTYLEASKALK
ncbi:MAG: hypothetical protein JKY12_00360 [Sneathiella sp.]|nr:hypothetical protein [Sneathiella sp.]